MWPVPQAAKKKKKKKGKIIASGAGLEGLVDWVDPNAINPAEERGRTICLALLLDFPCRCSSERRVLRVPLALKYLTESAQGGLARMKRLKRAWQ